MRVTETRKDLHVLWRVRENMRKWADSAEVLVRICEYEERSRHVESSLGVLETVFVLEFLGEMSSMGAEHILSQ